MLLESGMPSNFLALSGPKISAAAVMIHGFTNSSPIMYLFVVVVVWLFSLFEMNCNMKYREEICR